MSKKRVSSKEAMKAAERAIAAGNKSETAKALVLFGALIEMASALKGIETEITGYIEQYEHDIACGDEDGFFKLHLEKWRNAREAMRAGERVIQIFVDRSRSAGSGASLQDNAAADND